MTSKKLGALLRSVPPATASEEDHPPETVSEPPAKASRAPKVTEAADHEVPLQVLIPAHIRTELAILAATEGTSLRALMLRAIKSLGITVTKDEILGKRGRKKS